MARASRHGHPRRRTTGPRHARAQHADLRHGDVAFDTAAEKEDAVDRAMAWDPTAYFYSRTGNPTNRALEEKIASLEGAEDSVVASSGMASVAATLFANLEAGDHLVVGDELFAITRVLMDEDLPRRGISVTSGHTTDLAAVEARVHAGHQAAVPRVLHEPAPPDRRSRRDLGARARARDHGRRGQHVPGPGTASAARARRGHRPPRRDEVPLRAR